MAGILSYFFGKLPAIVPFLSEAERLVSEHEISMPFTYYIHSFWVLLLWALIHFFPRFYPEDWPPFYERQAHYFVNYMAIIAWVVVFISIIILFQTNIILDLIFEEYDGSLRSFKSLHVTRLKPIVFVFFGLTLVTDIPSKLILLIHNSNILTESQREKIYNKFTRRS